MAAEDEFADLMLEQVSDGEVEVEVQEQKLGAVKPLVARQPRKFLIALDLIADAVNESYSAFDYVACIIRAEDEIVIVSSYGSAAAANCDSCDLSRKAKVYKRLQRLKRHTKTNTKCQNVTAIISSHDPPGEMVVRQANTHKPTYIVVGSREKTAAASIVFGSCSQYVVHKSKFPVIVVNKPSLAAETLPDGKRKTIINYRVPGRVLCLYDGSVPSQTSIQHALDNLVSKDQDGIDVLMVQKKPQNNAEKYARLSDADQEDGELEWATTAGANTRNGVNVTPFMRYGDVRETVTEVAEGGEYTTLVMGARGRGTMKRLVLGSVSDYCLRHLNVPAILIVKS